MLTAEPAAIADYYSMHTTRADLYSPAGMVTAEVQSGTDDGDMVALVLTWSQPGVRDRWQKMALLPGSQLENIAELVLRVVAQARRDGTLPPAPPAPAIESQPVAEGTL